MIKRLYIDGGFQHQDRTFNFEGGLTSVIGPNGAGKSLVLEFIRYALFGTAALRGGAPDYKKLHVELDFEANGHSYQVVRNRQVSLHEGAVQLAAGTTAVNQKIKEILGYDLTVFDVANACNQGEVEALGNMRPAQRKTMVDQTIGLSVMDDIIKELGEEVSGLNKQVSTLRPLVNEPVAPVLPKDYLESAELFSQISTLNGLISERNNLTGWLASSRTAPVAPTCEVEANEEELLAHQSLVSEAKNTLAGFQAALQASRNQLVRLEAQRSSIQKQISFIDEQRRQLVLPEVTEEQLQAAEKQLADYAKWQQKLALLSKGENTCPACAHHWPLEADRLAEYEHVCEVEAPKVSQKQINQLRSQLGNFEADKAYAQQIQQQQETLAEVLTKIQAQEALIEEADGQVKAFTLPVDRSQELAILRAHALAMAAYSKAAQDYAVYLAEVAVKKTRLGELVIMALDVGLALVQAQYSAALTYEAEQRGYEKALKTYRTNLADLERLQAEALDYGNARRAVAELKSRIKGFLLPSLNKTASYLLNQMTGGEMSTIAIDEEFNILVDGLELHKLSGSGKSVANLAIRIGLGQVLTNKVFSVFMADEIDAAMDEERAAYTAQCLRRLTESIGQVILVTHKRPETDHVFELSK